MRSQIHRPNAPTMFALSPALRSLPPPTATAFRGDVQLAVNYSAAASRLVRQEAVEVDLFKCPDLLPVLETAGRQKPLYVHFPLYAGRREGAVIDLDVVAERLALTRTPHVNACLDPQVDRHGGVLGGLFDAIQRSVRDVATLVTHFGAGLVVVENAPYYGRGASPHSLAAEPAFIGQVVEETGCGFLLNLAHAHRAARSLGMDPRRYISLLPVEALRALHVTGTPTRADRANVPRPMTDQDWELFNWVVACIREGAWGRPGVVALEYGGVGPWFDARMDAAVLTQQIACVRQAVGDLSGGRRRAAVPDGLARA